MVADFYHEPVMLKEVIDSLLVGKTGVYVDCTVGGAGHAYAILKETDALLVGIDCDEEALLFAENRLAEFGSRKILVKANFADLGKILKDLNVEKVDGVLMDLGVSSHQLDVNQRGFSFSQQAPLDMRMDRSLKISAYDIVNSFAQNELENIIRSYGEEKMAARIARTISKKRQLSPIETTKDLASIVASCMPAKLKWQKIHPATRTFQAIRIAVNNELDNIKPAIDAAVEALKPGGRLCVISFHSLEDRIVKNEIRSLEGGCVCPKDVPFCVCQKEAKLKNLTRKVIVPAAEEIEANPRARSAKLRVAGRL
ncbi:MAG: 16S rRNA (cytosine(1402)-N(4))-methyltransferase [Deltaproteobacteria bacterium HGW-Deltaproteobacteria-13]|jgi:16S rRNA (cytosine1402-N4)-methyltransferase|nr:MAG: 16S rRNA (cytosine(1402)-N(4))-methyltransferase [Deltaproteobacteria bacterium HGW-Deltaproteobacteria-13]